MRRQPLHSPVAGSIWQIETHGDDTLDSTVAPALAAGSAAAIDEFSHAARVRRSGERAAALGAMQLRAPPAFALVLEAVNLLLAERDRAKFAATVG